MSKRGNAKRNFKKVAAAAAVCTVPFMGQMPVANADEPQAQPTMIFVDGTQKILPFGEAEGAADVANGAYLGIPGFRHWWVDYDRSFWPFTGLFDPTLGKSVQNGTQNTVNAFKEAKAEYPDQAVVMIGLSQGAMVLAKTEAQLERDGLNTPDTYYVLVGSPVAYDGGILTRLRLPGRLVTWLFLGIPPNDQLGTTPSQTANIVQIRQQYDGITDFPDNPLNLLADVNAVLGFFYYHGKYSEVDLQDPTNVITTSPSGLTDILIKRELPLSKFLKDVGVPDNIVDAITPGLTTLVEQGYHRPDPSQFGTYPDEPVRFGLPPLKDWGEEFHTTVTGVKQIFEGLAQLGKKEAPIAPLTVENTVNAAAATGNQPEEEAQQQEPEQEQRDSQQQVQPQGSSAQQQEPEQPQVQQEQVQSPANQVDNDQDSQEQDSPPQQPAEPEKPLSHSIRHSFRATPGASRVDQARGSDAESEDQGNANEDADKHPRGGVRQALKHLSGALNGKPSGGADSESSSNGGDSGGES